MTTDDMEIASSVRLALAQRVGQQRYDLWFGAGTRLRVTPHSLCVSVATQFKLDWLRKQFRDDLHAAALQVLGKSPNVEFLVDPTIDDAAPPAEGNAADKSPSDPPAKSPPAKLHSRRRFANLDSFVVGDGSLVASTAAQMVLQQPGQVSPLYIHGPTGVGKTHLLEGIWSAAKRQRSMRRILYLTAEQFTSFFLEALHARRLPGFRAKYRDVDLLLIDDVHFFSGKHATAIELQHTIETLLRQGRQLVFAASRPPADLTGLTPELVARLSGGLVCGVEPPDVATRLKILRQFAAKDGLQLEEDVLELLAARLCGDARRLAGALNSLRATSQATGQPVARALAEEVLADMFLAGPVVRLDDIERAVCDVLGMEPKVLKSNERSRRASHPRMLAMWLARKHTGAALSEIGRYFGRRSHTTVLSAERKVSRWLADGTPMALADRHWKVTDAVQKIELRLQTG